MPMLRPSLAFCAIAHVCCGVGADRTADARSIRPVQQARIAFDIPAQSLDAALALYFRMTGVQLLYDSGITSQRRSSPVRGNFTPREALRRMLAGSGLVANYTRSDAVVIAVADMPKEGESSLIPLGRVVIREPAPVRRVSPLERLAFYKLLETAIRERLATDRRTARLAFNAIVAVQVDENGIMSEVRVERGSGSAATDRLLTVVLTGAPGPIPPEPLAQPLRIAVNGRRPPS